MNFFFFFFIIIIYYLISKVLNFKWVNLTGRKLTDTTALHLYDELFATRSPYATLHTHTHTRSPCYTRFRSCFLTERRPHAERTS